jgi:hypothetical protein
MLQAMTNPIPAIIVGELHDDSCHVASPVAPTRGQRQFSEPRSGA